MSIKALHRSTLAVWPFNVFTFVYAFWLFKVNPIGPRAR